MVELGTAFVGRAFGRPTPVLAQTGDSRLANGRLIQSNATARYLHGVGSWVAFLTKGKISAPLSYNKAVSSSTLTSYVGDGGQNVKGLIPADGSPGQLADVLALNPLPSHCLMLDGTNSIAVGLSLVTMKTTMLTAWTTLLAVGIVPVVLLDFPRGWTTSATRLKHFAWNAWLMINGPKYGAVIIDATPVLMDPSSTNGDPLAALYYDSAPAIHPGNNGCYLAATPIAAYFNSLPTAQPFHGFSAGDIYDATNNPGGNLLPNGGVGYGTAGIKSGTNVTGTVASGMQVLLLSGSVTACVCSLEARTDGGAGNWQKIDLTTSGAAQIWFYPQSDVAASPGEVIEMGMDIDASGISAAVTMISSRLLDYSSGGQIGEAWAIGTDLSGGGKGALPAAFAGRAEIDPFTLLATTTRAIPLAVIAVSGAVTNAILKVGGMSMRRQQA